MDNFLLYLIAFLIFPGFLFTSSFGLIVSWIDRKVSALLQWRVGPPFFQPFYDLLKLWNKELVIPSSAKTTGFIIAPFVGITAASLLATMLGVINLNPEIRFVGDAIVILYLLIIPPLAIIWGGFASGNPIGSLGANREIKMIMGYELPFIIAVATVFFKVGTISLGEIIQYQQTHGVMLNHPSMIIAFIASLLCLQAKLAEIPFDISEAECEIMEGPFIEYSGPLLGIYKVTQAMLHVVVPWFLISLFWGGTMFQGWGILWSLLKYLAIITIVILIKNTNPRLRIDQAVKFFWGWVTILAVVAMIVMFLGY
ncbi:MAG: NADH-quinone oxidoreductase subunit H [Calditrichaeota bacterium]|nr:NADH-quinone oxidoreductase subunit H [Calditrichota bacterium]RQV92179.1 MAG: NADH-quinone oxidoreductase subunit H [bacterium]